MSRGCCSGGCAVEPVAEVAKVNEPVRELYENENFKVGVRAIDNRYYLFNKFTGVLEQTDIVNYVEALYMAEQFNYALINKTYVMDKVDFGAMLNFTGDSTVQ